MDDSSAVPDAITFEQAIALTQALMADIELGNLSEDQIQSTIAALVASENGARGFFVTYLTDDRTLADSPSTAVVRALQSAPETVAELLVKNLAMSTAMAIAHRRSQNEAIAQGSDRVQQRTVKLIDLVELPEVNQKAQKLQQSAATGTGDYQAFLDRWGYDAEQRQQIMAVLQTVKHVNP
ncbi:MAG: hypothetical protein HY785_23105 [Oscillatoriophycideae cyanobacterium NC_groundwater_1537_Pr4_S-0.65um_50_18]|nr:hypothetical protein [Oscillatoriophycideae cyanobacterium NC_groundwater_1537_Pr4_S-0.65um_50_18]